MSGIVKMKRFIFLSVNSITLFAVFLMAMHGCTRDKQSSLIKWNFEAGKNIKYKYTRETRIVITGESDFPLIEDIERVSVIKAKGDIIFKPKHDGTVDLTLSLGSKAGAESSHPFLPRGFLGTSPKLKYFTVNYLSDGTVFSDADKSDETGFMAQFLLDEFFQLPPNPNVQPGDTWEKKIVIPNEEDDRIEGTINTTFIGWEEFNGVRYAKFKSDMKTRANIFENKMELTLDTNGEGHWVFSPSFGCLMSSEVNYTFNIKVIADMKLGSRPISKKSVRVELTASGEEKAELRQQY